MITNYEYFYDSQIRRYLEQLVRAFSGYQYQTGRTDVDPQIKLVPCRLALTNRMVANIMRNNSENTLLAAPLITIFQSGLTYDSNRLQNPIHIDKQQVFERDKDNQGNYLNGPGQKYTIERMMPRPFTMKVQVDIWTSNMDQKHQLAEQILTVIVPTFDIQNSDNALDWSSITTCVIDDITWSSQTVPIGTDSEIDIMTINLSLPMWLNPPAKVMQQRVIEEVITTTYEGLDPTNLVDDTPYLFRNIVTPGNHAIKVENGIITLLNKHGNEFDDNDDVYSWIDLFPHYGKFRPAISTISLKMSNNLDNQTDMVIGTIQLENGHPNRLSWQPDPDTIPSNTLAPIDAIINPLQTYPNHGLASPVAGQRYLILEDISPSVAWGSLNAGMNDIIQYDGTSWAVSFDSSNFPNTTHFVLNLYNNDQFKWIGHDWIMSIDGEYSSGYWRLDL